ncbi:MAG: hypothetical protein UW46_C0006G0030 [Candidatus Yanofskybacteria bacterium GW2011_GWF1_44_227]|uniref:DUF1918 domain-containing protein n=1 Tax=Candidatus Yanofskybacteria bacterium GW2011_GWE2_40_11 TaxID=1619033 RepID=A0A0G0QKU6_9BACT|nr:MAG: hypothetical protein UT69_C0002G0025 [Candidatus Yanofskybacteria bacterium GW2011_GWE1_40_10]KKR41044.1 MAG: hypothetical protein UT75_C0002G0081 [Candidatus Yanofskybacteria bacterium GW2011_GWE2_40_11]KKT15455.1 MAG: hypothetical protein UV97_C0006G0022 [Candidatus Yanofskybacteria bacterium GW2011_GWF2_43_596]KKT53129.1 MAG: hypothetical protein UW46_C0006G0030 [Candidatus Yanofskybacteria bacterium GW2011_GWF1_44_227]OGN40184.1 MAG: hypothetical protein A2457_00870 [Candidatus Yano
MSQDQSKVDSRIKVGSIVSRRGQEYRVTEFTHGCCGGDEQVRVRDGNGFSAGPFYTDNVKFVR